MSTVKHTFLDYLRQRFSPPPAYAFTYPQGADSVRDRYWLHVLLFAITSVTTMMAGATMVTNGHWWPFLNTAPQQQLGPGDLMAGLPYAAAFLAFLTCHEFGHYFAARWHKVSTSLPYYIPVFLPIPINIGSFGAVIRIRERPRTTNEYFDIGIAGPIAGFVVAIGLLVYGFLTLPELNYLLQMNPDYIGLFGGVPSEQQLLAKYGGGIKLGNSLLFWGLSELLADPARMPNHFELFHYPFLFVGYITLFFTALNLLPIGQLDGGHVIYGLFGRRRAGIISRLFILGLVTYGGIGAVQFADPSWPIHLGVYLLYLFVLVPRLVQRDLWLSGFLIGLIITGQQIAQAALPGPHMVNVLWLFYPMLATLFIKPDHPPAPREAPLNARRRWVGWLGLAMFVLCFSPRPIEVVMPETSADAESAETVAPVTETLKTPQDGKMGRI